MKYPKHVWLIPDGNRTWAKENWKLQLQWHYEWFKRVNEIANYIFTNTPIEAFTVWGLSTENLKNRSEEELEYLFELYKTTTENLDELLKKQKVSFRIAGDKTKLPKHLSDFLTKKEKEFNYPNNKTLVLAVNYWWQDEILRAIKKLINKNKEINKDNLENEMDFGWLPYIDLVIRTKQKLAKRLSGFMLRRIGYAQLYFTDLYCPEFTIEEFQKALQRYDSKVHTQNFGK